MTSTNVNEFNRLDICIVFARFHSFFTPTRFSIAISADRIYKSETIIFLYLVLLLFVSRNGGNLFDVIKGRKTRKDGKGMRKKVER